MSATDCPSTLEEAEARGLVYRDPGQRPTVECPACARRFANSDVQVAFLEMIDHYEMLTWNDAPGNQHAAPPCDSCGDPIDEFPPDRTMVAKGEYAPLCPTCSEAVQDGHLDPSFLLEGDE